MAWMLVAYSLKNSKELKRNNLIKEMKLEGLILMTTFCGITVQQKSRQLSKYVSLFILLIILSAAVGDFSSRPLTTLFIFG